MTVLMQAHHQWASRPDDERFESMQAMFNEAHDQRARSRDITVPTRDVQFKPVDNHGLVLQGKQNEFGLYHWAFNQFCQRANAPADYFRDTELPSPLIADQLNWHFGTRLGNDPDNKLKLLLNRNGHLNVKAATSEGYGRVWNADFIQGFMNRMDTNVWKPPGEFGKPVVITKANTTLFMGDRDMFFFLCDEGSQPIEVGHNPRDVFSRGIFGWNSEVGARSYGIASFLYRYACCNRMIHGASEFAEKRFRHTSGAPEKFIEELLPAIEA